MNVSLNGRIFGWMLGALLLLVPAVSVAEEVEDAAEEAVEAAERTEVRDVEFGAEGYDWSDVVQQPRFILRGFGGQAQSGGETGVLERLPITDPNFEHFHVNVGNGPGFGLAAEFRLACRLGLEIGAARYELDASLVYDSPVEWLMADDDITLTLITLGLNIHLTPKARADLYIGPLVALADTATSNFAMGGSLGNVSTGWDDDFVFGAQIGIDIPFRHDGGWALHGNVRYLNGITLAADANRLSGLEVDIDPFFFNVGLAYRFGRDRGPLCGHPVAIPPPPPPPAPPPPVEPTPPTPPPAPSPPPQIRESCQFASGSARLDNICQAKLDEVALQMQDDPQLSAQVTGYSDSSGATQANQAMSERRAQAVEDYLVTRHGIDSNRITTQGRGEADPIASNDTADGRAQNRRVEILLQQQ